MPKLEVERNRHQSITSHASAQLYSIRRVMASDGDSEPKRKRRLSYDQWNELCKRGGLLDRPDEEFDKWNGLGDYMRGPVQAGRLLPRGYVMACPDGAPCHPARPVV